MEEHSFLRQPANSTFNLIFSQFTEKKNAAESQCEIHNWGPFLQESLSKSRIGSGIFYSFRALNGCLETELVKICCCSHSSLFVIIVY